MTKKYRFLFWPLFIIGILLVLTTGCHKKDSTETSPAITLTDIDGNVYKTVTIGSQVWMAENLKVKHYRNGSLIPQVTDNTEWGNLTSGAWCYLDNDAANAGIYGLLYNWFAVNDLHNLAPTGWHIPSDAEVAVLVNYLGGVDVAGDKLKETGTVHWIAPNQGASNSSGFSALGSGYRTYTGTYQEKNYSSSYWNSIEFNEFNGDFWSLSSGMANVYSNSYFKVAGMSIRCIKD